MDLFHYEGDWAHELRLFWAPNGTSVASDIWRPKKSRFMGPITRVLKNILPETIMNRAVKFSGALVVLCARTHENGKTFFIGVIETKFEIPQKGLEALFKNLFLVYR